MKSRNVFENHTFSVWAKPGFWGLENERLPGKTKPQPQPKTTNNNQQQPTTTSNNQQPTTNNHQQQPTTNNNQQETTINNTNENPLLQNFTNKYFKQSTVFDNENLEDNPQFITAKIIKHNAKNNKFNHHTKYTAILEDGTTTIVNAKTILNLWGIHNKPTLQEIQKFEHTIQHHETEDEHDEPHEETKKKKKPEESENNNDEEQTPTNTDEDENEDDDEVNEDDENKDQTLEPIEIQQAQ